MNIQVQNLPNATESILKGKFSKTIQTIEGSFQEANGDEKFGTEWTIGKIKSDIEKIRANFYMELKYLAEEIEMSVSQK